MNFRAFDCPCENVWYYSRGQVAAWKLMKLFQQQQQAIGLAGDIT